MKLSIGVPFAAAFAMALVLWPAGASGVVLQDSNQPAIHPSDNIVGRYGTNASLVVISPDYAITTRHQGDSSTVVINGTTYYDTAVATGGPSGNSDIRIIRLWKDSAHTVDANLSNFSGLYNGTNEIGAQITIGGHGRTAGTALKANGDANITYAFMWGGNNNNTNPVTWGTNKIEETDIGGGTYTSDVIVGYFDRLDTAASTPYEAIPAAYDSGGGYFISVNGQWYVAGLTRGVQRANVSVFRDPNSPYEDMPDGFDGVRVSSYASWITSNVPESVSVIPEPVSLSLMLAGTAAVLARRRRA